MDTLIKQLTQFADPIGTTVVNKVRSGARYATYEVYTETLNAVAAAVHNIAESPENADFRLNSVAMTYINNAKGPYRAVVVLERNAAEPVKDI